MKLEKLLLSLVAAAAMAACSSTKLEEKPPVEDKPATPVQQNTAPTAPAARPPVATVDLGAQLDAAVSNQRIVYFDFDSYAVKDDYATLISNHAKRLNNKKSLTLSLEGHTDARGGSEYNLALGQKRAEAVAKALTLLGVSSSQVEPVSFGKERPVDTGTTEEAYAKNRRVELRDK